MCAQSKGLGTHTKFQLEILIRITISAIHKFRENILESSRNVSEITPWNHYGTDRKYDRWICHPVNVYPCRKQCVYGWSGLCRLESCVINISLNTLRSEQKWLPFCRHHFQLFFLPLSLSSAFKPVGTIMGCPFSDLLAEGVVIYRKPCLQG